MDTFTPASPSFLGPHHLVHRPGSPEAFLLKATAPIRQNFAFSAQLPEENPLFGDSASPYHDLLFPLESLRRTMSFAARRYFRVPAGRRLVMASAGAAVTRLDAWRRDGRRAGIALDLGMTPLDVVSGVPRGLECQATVSIDGKRCGTASARLVFPAQEAHQSPRALGGQEGEGSAAARDSGPASAGLPLPEQVGRLDSRDVLVGPPAYAGPDDGGGLVFPVRATTAAELPADAPGALPPVLLLELSRQVGLLAAAELRGFVPSYAVLSRWQATFRSLVEPGVPLRCSVREGVRRADGQVSRDEAGRPVIDLRLSFRQGERVVAGVSAAVVQDC
ncbi:AfsA-related hotdog domain-containing protein [Streptomyces sp. NPDC048106]|uniref:AfsA-related hotdog domain-containing protein n=1 Tax=Streptomyces sp. NPDC048106 TaxID=3155750 RepID=UPI003452E579